MNHQKKIYNLSKKIKRLIEKIGNSEIYKASISHADYEYLKCLDAVFSNTANQKFQDNRTGTKTIKSTYGLNINIPLDTSINLKSYFRHQHAFNLPRLYGKRVKPNLAFVEAVWMLLGRTDVKWLKKYNLNYWDSWIGEDGTIGDSYGKQFRNFMGYDQVLNLMKEMRENPFNRRLLINLWNPTEVLNSMLPPCLTNLQFVTTQESNQKAAYIRRNGYNEFLDVKFYDVTLHAEFRSSDIFIGLPYDLMLVTFIGHLITQYMNMRTYHDFHKGKEDVEYKFFNIKNLSIKCNDAHIYENHIDGVESYVQNLFDFIDSVTDRTFKKYYTDVPDLVPMHAVLFKDISFEGYIQKLVDNVDSYDKYQTYKLKGTYNNFEQLKTDNLSIEYVGDSEFKFIKAPVAV